MMSDRLSQPQKLPFVRTVLWETEEQTGADPEEGVTALCLLLRGKTISWICHEGPWTLVYLRYLLLSSQSPRLAFVLLCDLLQLLLFLCCWNNMSCQNQLKGGRVVTAAAAELPFFRSRVWDPNQGWCCP